MRTILTNASILTGDAVGTCHTNGALAIRDGKVDWVGPAEALVPEPDDVVRDLGGAVVIPGLVNTHAHGGLSLARGAVDDGDLFEWAAALAPHTANLTVEDNRWACHLAVFEMLRNGVTTACDCTRYGAGVFAEVASAIGLRSLSGALANSPALRSNGRPNWPLALAETEEAIAAQSGNRLARFYLGAHSPYNCTPDLLQEVKAQADQLGLPFVIHVAENRKEHAMIRERYGVRPVEHLHRLGVLGHGAILAHCIWVDGDEIAMIADAGAGVAHNPVSNGKLASGVAPVPELRAAGVPVGLGTDSMLSNNGQDLFREMLVAVLLQRTHRLDGFALTATDAFRMATLEGARVLSWDNEIGSLEPGKAADLVILDLFQPRGPSPQRLLSDVVFLAGPQHVREVMVAGRSVYAGGRFPQLDDAPVKARIRSLYASKE